MYAITIEDRCAKSGAHIGFFLMIHSPVHVHQEDKPALAQVQIIGKEDGADAETIAVNLADALGVDIEDTVDEDVE